MFSVVKSVRIMQIACALAMIAYVAVHFAFLTGPKLESAIIADASGQTLILNGKDTPITKTKEKTKYPDSAEGYQWYPMLWLKLPICTVEIDGASVPVLAAQWNISKRTKMVVKVVPADEAMKTQLGLKDYTQADYMLVQQRSHVEALLSTVAIFLGLKLCQVGFRRAKENAEG